ncbi:hypothetical protein SmJEL517_g04281 [Synchytrium microbalum]|uniref:Uncharacterized protein n=1 Tax=Synchytrium microbalum TaxID=1806994 RepID=A0A507C0S5_9FUNG|nr:uncharacterized protein SmJEL517_g04281 [Synchytrium microbalum]TPX32649.1 hypothetical protein SmJEL517_g04281 [Synchytrium microbalum]
MAPTPRSTSLVPDIDPWQDEAPEPLVLTISTPVLATPRASVSNEWGHATSSWDAGSDRHELDEHHKSSTRSSHRNSVASISSNGSHKASSVKTGIASNQDVWSSQHSRSPPISPESQKSPTWNTANSKTGESGHYVEPVAAAAPVAAPLTTHAAPKIRMPADSDDEDDVPAGISAWRPSVDWRNTEAELATNKASGNEKTFRSNWSWSKKEEAKRLESINTAAAANDRMSRSEPEPVRSPYEYQQQQYQQQQYQQQQYQLQQPNETYQSITRKSEPKRPEIPRPMQPKFGVGFGSSKKSSSNSSASTPAAPTPLSPVNIKPAAAPVVRTEDSKRFSNNSAKSPQDREPEVHGVKRVSSEEWQEDDAEESEQDWEEDSRVSSVNGKVAVAEESIPDWFANGGSPPTNDWTDVESPTTGKLKPSNSSRKDDYVDTTAIATPTILNPSPMTSPLVPNGLTSPTNPTASISPSHFQDLLEPGFLGIPSTTTFASTMSSGPMPSAEDIDRLFGTIYTEDVKPKQPEPVINVVKKDVKKPSLKNQQQTATPPITPIVSPKKGSPNNSNSQLLVSLSSDNADDEATLVSPTSIGRDHPEYLSIYHALPIFQVVASSASHAPAKGAVLGALARSAATLSSIKGEVIPKSRRGDGGIRQVFCTFISDEGVQHAQGHLPASVVVESLLKSDVKVSDQSMLTAIQTKLSSSHSLCSGRPGILFLDTPRGFNDPAPSGTLQSIAYRPLRLPIILVGGNDVSSIISTYESGRIRGYDVVAILIEDVNESVLEVVEQNVDGGVIVECFPPMPTLSSSIIKTTDNDDLTTSIDDEATEKETKWAAAVGDIADVVVADLIAGHCRRVENLSDLAERGRRRLWWPNIQHMTLGHVIGIESEMDQGIISYKAPTKDESAQDVTSPTGTSTFWLDATAGGRMTWTSANHRLALSLASAASRYGSTALSAATTEPAVVLAEKLAWSVGKQWSSRVFYTDSGKDAIEVGLKMAIRYYESINREERWARDDVWNGTWEVIGIVGGGVNDSAAPSILNRRDNWYTGRGHWFNAPYIVYKDGKYHVRIPAEVSLKVVRPDSLIFDSVDDVFKISRDNSILMALYLQHIHRELSHLAARGRRFGALLIPSVLVQSTDSSMKVIDPLFQRALARAVRSSDRNHFNRGTSLPVVMDETFSGLYRLGVRSGWEWIDVKPDVLCLGNTLGFMGAVLASREVFKSFTGVAEIALYVAQNYAGNPVSCQMALANLADLSRSPMWDDRTERFKQFWDAEDIARLSKLPIVEGAVGVGTVLVVHFNPVDDQNVLASIVAARLRDERIIADVAPFGVSLIVNPSSSKDVAKSLVVGLYRALQKCI